VFAQITSIFSVATGVGGEGSQGCCIHRRINITELFTSMAAVESVEQEDGKT
jgi:hypothetical protein